MKNLIYAGIIGACILVAAVVFVKTRGGGASGTEISDTEMTWVKCLKCGAGYEMGLKQYYDEVRAKPMISASGLPITPPLTCQKCGKDGIVKACKCDNCGEIFRENTVQGDFPDRCPKCKHSATEARREANRARQQGQ